MITEHLAQGPWGHWGIKFVFGDSKWWSRRDYMITRQRGIVVAL